MTHQPTVCLTLPTSCDTSPVAMPQQATRLLQPQDLGFTAHTLQSQSHRFNPCYQQPVLVLGVTPRRQWLPAHACQLLPPCTQNVRVTGNREGSRKSMETGW
ncbi:hypothetical protein KIL84_002244 [Mauremys mutica]|uniref:Uncharacterized protein n=1 Tax=Mauremys mutica TaxID=74926 RepID=A0A9D3X7H0_9SAUR|nr:hypothetical protein KIL84_002244 [Mauremys mutica]